MKAKQVWGLLLILLVGLSLRLNNLTERSLWVGEFVTLFQSSGHGVDAQNLTQQISQKPISPILKALGIKKFLCNDPNRQVKDVIKGTLLDSQPPLYYLLMYFWIKWAGNGIFAIRLFSVLISLCCIVLVFFVSRRIFDEDIAIFSSFFISISAFSCLYAQEARNSTMVLMLGLLSWLFFLRFESDNKNLDLWGFVLFNCLGFYTHYLFFLIVIVQAAHFFVHHKGQSARLNKFYLSILCSILIFIPWIVFAVLNGQTIAALKWFLGTPGFLAKIWYLLTGATKFIAIPIKRNVLSIQFFIGGLSLFAYLAYYALRDMPQPHRRGLLLCVKMIVIPVSIMFIIDLLGQGVFLRQEHFWTFSFIGFIPLAGYIIRYGFAKRMAVVYLVVIFIVLSSLGISAYSLGPEPKSISQWLNQDYSGKGAVVVVFDHPGVLLSQAYYLDDDVDLMPIADSQQLSNSLRMSADLARTVYVAHYFHYANPRILEPAFMQNGEMNLCFLEYKIENEIIINGIILTKYVARY